MNNNPPSFEFDTVWFDPSGMLTGIFEFIEFINTTREMAGIYECQLTSPTRGNFSAFVTVIVECMSVCCGSVHVCYLDVDVSRHS